MIFLNILKIIGIILLVILGIVVFLLLVLLFCPIKYWANGKVRTTEYHIDYKVRWLFGIFRAYGVESNDESEGYYKIFWVKTNLYGEEDEYDDFDDEIDDLEDKKTDESKSDNGQNVINKSEEAVIEEKTVKEVVIEDNINKDDIIDEKNVDEIVSLTQKNEQYNKVKEKKDSSNILEKLCGWINSIKEKYKNIKVFLKNIPKKVKSLYKKIRKKKRKIFYILQDESCKAGIDHLKKELFILLKKIIPKKMKMDLKFCMAEPDKTGFVVGLLAMFPIVYKTKWNVYPDFEGEKLYVDADFRLKGRIYLIDLVIILLRLYVDKNCRKLYNIINR